MQKERESVNFEFAISNGTSSPGGKIKMLSSLVTLIILSVRSRKKRIDGNCCQTKGERDNERGEGKEGTEEEIRCVVMQKQAARVHEHGTQPPLSF